MWHHYLRQHFLSKRNYVKKFERLITTKSSRSFITTSDNYPTFLKSQFKLIQQLQNYCKFERKKMFFSVITIFRNKSQSFFIKYFAKKIINEIKPQPYPASKSHFHFFVVVLLLQLLLLYLVKLFVARHGSEPLSMSSL